MTEAVQTEAVQNEWISLSTVAKRLHTVPRTILWRIDCYNAEFPEIAVAYDEGAISPAAYEISLNLDAYLRKEPTADIEGWLKLIHGSKGSSVRGVRPTLPVQSFGQSAPPGGEAGARSARGTREARKVDSSSTQLSAKSTDYSNREIESPPKNVPTEEIVGDPNTLLMAEYMPSTIVRKVEDFFGFNQRFGGYPVLEYLAKHEITWGLAAHEFDQLIDFRPSRAVHNYDCFVLVRSADKSPFRQTENKPLKQVYTWRVYWRQDYEELQQKNREMEFINAQQAFMAARAASSRPSEALQKLLKHIKREADLGKYQTTWYQPLTRKDLEKLEELGFKTQIKSTPDPLKGSIPETEINWKS